MDSPCIDSGLGSAILPDSAFFSRGSNGPEVVAQFVLPENAPEGDRIFVYAVACAGHTEFPRSAQAPFEVN